MTLDLGDFSTSPDDVIRPMTRRLDDGCSVEPVFTSGAWSPARLITRVTQTVTAKCGVFTKYYTFSSAVYSRLFQTSTKHTFILY